MRYRLRTDQLQRLLADSRLSQNHWAIRLGFSRGHWSDIVNGKHPYPSTKTRERLVEVLGVSFESLFELQVTTAPNADVEFRSALADRYLIDRELGQGAMGTVYLARDVAHGRLVAIKQMSREAVCGVGVNAFLREISVASRLQHPNILPLFAAGAAADHPYFVMPWVRGGSLRDRLTREVRLPLGGVRNIVNGLSSALTYAHGEHVLHCDIKPENILMHGEHAWLTDFGVSRILHAEASEWRARTSIDISAGTPAYVSPEQANGEDNLDGRADVYSLGCVVYEMLTGRAPFEGESTEVIVARRFISAPPPMQDFAPELSGEVVAVVATAMEVSRERRVQTPEAFAVALGQATGTPTPFERAASAVSRVFTRATASLRRTMGKNPAFGFAALVPVRPADVRYAWRHARAAPTLTAITIATLAIAIALTTTTWSLVDHVLLRALPFAAPERIVALLSVDSLHNEFGRVSSANWLDWQRDSHSFEHSAIYATRSSSLRDGEVATRIPAAMVSSDFFTVLRPRFVVGRAFTPPEAQSDGAYAVVSERLWKRLLAEDSTLRKTLRGLSRDVQVVGVVADGHDFPAGTDVWYGVDIPPQPSGTRNNVNWNAIARLKPGVTEPQARADLARVAGAIRSSDPRALYSYGVGVKSLQSEIVGGVDSYLLMLSGAVAFVLLIACANVASANLGRGKMRAREFAVRAALGAGRGRILQQLLTEHVFIACLAGVLGIGSTFMLLRGIVLAWGSQIPRVNDMHIDPRVLTVAVVVTVLSGILSGVIPAIVGSSTPGSALASTGSRGASRGGRNIPGASLVAAQIAIALVLVCGSLLMLQSFRYLISRDLGFNVSVATIEGVLSAPKFQTGTDSRYRYWDLLRRRLAEVPGTAGAALSNSTPLGAGGTSFVELEENNVPGAGAGFRVISEDYLEIMHVALKQGRMFRATDDLSSPFVTIINEDVARNYFKGENPIGKRMRASSMESLHGVPAPSRTIVGVVASVRNYGFENDKTAEMYVPYRQAPFWVGTMTAVVGARGRIEPLIPAIAEAARRVDSDVALEIGTISQRVRNDTAARRMVVTLLSVFGAVALFLAALGIYGLLSYGVAQRTREMAIRSALGATRKQLMRLIFGGVGRIVLAGLALGVVSALLLTRFVESQLVDVGPTDLVAFSASIVVVFVTAVLATWVPARRAGRADPSDALRGE